MKKIVEIFSTGDLSEVKRIIASDYIDYQRLEGIDISGQEGFCQVVKAARQALPDLQVVIRGQIAADDKVVARLQWQSAGPTYIIDSDEIRSSVFI